MTIRLMVAEAQIEEVMSMAGDMTLRLINAFTNNRLTKYICNKTNKIMNIYLAVSYERRGCI